MKNSLLTILIALLVLTSCEKNHDKNTKGNSNTKKKITSMEMNSNINNKDDKKSKNKDDLDFTNIYKNLEGYFYQDGKFDGAYKKGIEGNIDMGLFNGKFKIIKKLSATSYILSLEDINYETSANSDKTELIGDRDWLIHYGKSEIFNEKNLNNQFTLFLPKSSLSNFTEEEKSLINMADFDKDKENKDFIEKFALKKNDDKSILLVEFKSDSEKFKKTDKNYYEDLLLDNASLFIDKSQFEYYDINPKDLGIN
ncbi:MAG: hypothetical protein E6706_06410 [Anaerococcus hydrogenalis]|nr:hypothetical protein [Anaerococcus hydrogenalis]